MSGFDDLDYLIDQPQKVLDLLDNDLLDIKDIKHAGICVSSIFNEVNKNLDNGFWLSFAIRLKSKELMYFYDDKKIIYSYKNLFNLINDYDHSVFVCNDYDNYLINQNLLNDPDFPHIPKLGELLQILNSIYENTKEDKEIVIELNVSSEVQQIKKKTQCINRYYGDISNIKPKEFYLLLRNQREEPYVTLRQDNIVKSKAEKWIADFLFEHGIDYIYEKEYDLTCLSGISQDLDQFLYNFGKKNTKPDFFLPKYNLIWEHWGIDENEQNQEKRKGFSKKYSTWEEYKYHMELKRDFWNKKRRDLIFSEWEYGRTEGIKSIKNVVGLIETSEVDLKKERYFFEQNIKKILETNGVIVRKRSEKELIDQVWSI